jgi:hypothetical protein
MMRFEALLGDADDLSPDGLQRVAQAFMRTTGDPRDLWFEVESFYATYSQATTDMHRNLASLPFSLCVQTTPDRLMRNAFDERTEKEPVEAYCHLREGIGVVGAGSGKHLVEPDPDHPLVFGLHGHAVDGESVVLTETDLLDFLVRLARDRTMLPQFLYNRFAAEQTTFLFMGFGFQSWYQRLMLHLLRGKSVGSGRLLRSLALEGEYFFSKEDPLKSATFYQEEHKLDFVDLSYVEFAAELKRRFEATAPERESTAQAERAPDPDAPMVFLSYDSRDEEAVERLAQALRARGIAAWRDHDNLRGGDDWNRVARHVLEKQVDYVVVLHSSNLGARESYAQLEINLALKRKDFLPPDWRFVIPCHFLGGQARLSQLEEYQYVEVATPEACDDLAQTIFEDWSGNERLQAKRAKAAP